MPDGGKLTIETTNAHLDSLYAAEQRDVTPGQYVCLSITDTGVGMSPAVQCACVRSVLHHQTDRAGDRASACRWSTGSRANPRGMSRIYSEIDAGTTVKLYLPRYRGAVEEAAATESIQSVEKAHDGETVLVIEDEHSVRELVVEVLNDLGYRALRPATGLRA